MALSDIVNNGNGAVNDSFDDLFNSTEAASERVILPLGTYRLAVETGKLTTSTQKQSKGYQVKLRVDDGEFVGTTFSHTFWLSGGALSYSKRDLVKLGIDSADKLNLPPADEVIISARVAQRASDDGGEFNEIRNFEVIERRLRRTDPFAPLDEGSPF